VGLALEFPLYMVMSHYHLGPKDLSEVSSEGFDMMFKWSMAHKQLEAQEMADADKEGKTQVGSTKMGKPMPFSEGW